jgi:TPP-dependent pyruvate/acetoin dehydrogenase alpha subunit
MSSAASAELRSFMRRSEALRLYRSALRAARLASPHARGAICAEARAHVAAAAAAARDDPAQERFLLAKGAEFVATLRELSLLAR